MKRISWEEYALKLAQIAAERSEDPYLKVGACALRYDNSVASLGYNGAPPGIEIDWSDRDERRKRICHAEVSCLRYCKPNEIRLLATTLCPCSNCLTIIASYKIPKIIFLNEDSVNYNFDETKKIAKEFGIKILSLREFKEK
jgi:dCMP deaminase